MGIRTTTFLLLLLTGATGLGSCAKGSAIDGAQIVFLLQPTGAADAGVDAGAAGDPESSSTDPVAAP